MKTSLIAATILMLAVHAKAETPAVPMVQILPVAASARTAPVARSTEDSFAAEQARELDFSKGVTASTAPVARTAAVITPAPQTPGPVKQTKTQTPAATTPVAQTPARGAQAPAQAAAPQAPVARIEYKPAHRTSAAPQSVHRMRALNAGVPANNAQLPSANSLPRQQADEASMIRNECQSKGRHVLKCMDDKITLIENQVDSLGTRLMNCREIRKFDRLADPKVVDAVVMSHFYKLRSKATLAFNEEASAESSRLEKSEIDLRATLNWREATIELTSRVCNQQAFAKMVQADLAALR